MSAASFKKKQHKCRKLQGLYKKDLPMYAGLLKHLHQDIKELEGELTFLRSESFQYTAAIDKSYLQLQIELSRLTKISHSRNALHVCHQHLTNEAFQFLYRQLLLYRKPHWDVQASKIPILLTKCGLKVWDVLQSLFRLPCKPTLLKYKALARKDPSLFDNSLLMYELVKKQHKSCFKRARRKDFGTHKIARTKLSVSDVLRDFIEKNVVCTTR
ncbi:uncharacterized protein LOC108677395 isoform X2 [Hyalella azteca]|uniref:Uncharacterized protein LOC108677395 isoform X1 n=1 Tax=Hyalella azteca TaxID=294128 RepID=A0A8B7P578_HYAAZ|nr:uncharacterized protein LOC108677395 isoform X1 [Hyalella azteca]XP_018021093.1 uncharacterized protein LOC108677395 isoform X2 [Hyalella azteca]